MIHRMPPGRALEARAEEGLADYALCRRAFALRERGAIGILLAECGRLYISDDAVDPWGNKRLISADELRALVDLAEKAFREVAA